MKWDTTPLQHAAIAACFVLIVWPLGNPWVGAAFGAALFIGREHAQAEYRWIERFGNGKRANMPWWGGFDYRVWDLGSLLDWIVPTVCVCLLAWLLNH